jgi:hypothetical protein
MPVWTLSAFCLLIIAGCATDPYQDVWTGIERVVAIGDVHGDYENFTRILRSADLIDGEDGWTGGKTHLIQTGDVLDRGAESRKVMDLLMTLEIEAAQAGGKVHALIGNHEAMNITGDLRYVSEGEYDAFRTSSSAAVRDAYYLQHQAELRENPPPEGLPEFDETYRKEWETKVPLGWVEHRRGFAPDGVYGEWILTHNAVVKVNQTLFMHGGIGPLYATKSIRELNQQIRAELQDFSKLENGAVEDREGPLWYRGLARDEESELQGHVDRLLAHHGVQRIVVGHTVTNGTVIPRLGGKVLMIDSGLSQHYGARLSCLEIDQGRAYTIHRGRRLEHPGPSGISLLEYLKNAAQLDPAPSPLQELIQSLAH